MQWISGSRSRSLVHAGWALVLVLSLAGFAPAGETRARCGQGFLETIDGYPVLHLKGNPYEMGYQHGRLLQEHVRQNLHYLLEIKGQQKIKLFGQEVMTAGEAVRTIAAAQRQFLPREFQEEQDGLADGAGVPRADIQLANGIPELFHCSGFAVLNQATRDGTLYHGRVLDYAVDWHLQDHAVLIVAEPDGGIPFVNVSYAGFIGSVTGMNAAGISIGEMGGKGQGHWQGVPMAFLVREVLQRARTLDEAIAIFRDQPRTCQYFYVIADGKNNRAVGMEASWNNFTLVKPGEAIQQLPHAVPDAVLLSAGSRYEELVRRVQTDWGKLDEVSARKLMDCGVAMKSNLHDVLFAPASTKFWVANASSDRQPAATQPYHSFQFTELLKHKADPRVPDQPCPQRPVH
ncbi:MAG: peptidase C45 [Planctomycetes bacterium]|nr:peptidase C45 [Planctomycetota bacterium]